MSRTVTTVFFDVGNTLLFPDRKRILAPLHQRQVSPTLAQWHAIERKTKKEFDAMVEGGNPDHGFWYLFYTHLLEELGIGDDGLRDALVEATRISDNWGDIRPGTRAALERIGGRFQIGVISNADGKIAALLERDGIADCFRNITDSGLVGKEKPHPAIFAAALEAMRVRPEESLYVGDVYSVDYQGATRAGMQAMLFDVSGAYRDTDLPRVESLEGLEKEISGWR
ncbi:MAG: HAD family hydrolase [Acidobacteriia bacterium]|nr:HAD family hydrolase [Terriglobia bacterium]